jgi:hypothetical protein
VPVLSSIPPPRRSIRLKQAVLEIVRHALGVIHEQAQPSDPSARDCRIELT